MLNSIVTGTEITTSAFLLCTAVSLALGLGTAALSMYKEPLNKTDILREPLNKTDILSKMCCFAVF